METILKRIVFDEIKKYLHTDDIIVLHGARQVGKTTILYYIEDYLKKQGEDTYFIDLEDSRFVRILDTGVAEFIRHLKEEGLLSQGRKTKTFVLLTRFNISPTPHHSSN